jgi:hypothetical protein
LLKHPKLLLFFSLVLHPVPNLASRPTSTGGGDRHHPNLDLTARGCAGTR